ncbi:hypothetical protein [Sphingomonas sp. Leaf20]|uniref:hypothetical protein n=1 Tax=Sphingomonas sp. Leaf20 TaxID=1735685 RepID=UPI001F3EB184|nr:hypothetical protein [Sphingomonas sp. Leaf20]
MSEIAQRRLRILSVGVKSADQHESLGAIARVGCLPKDIVRSEIVGQRSPGFALFAICPTAREQNVAVEVRPSVKLGDRVKSKFDDRRCPVRLIQPEIGLPLKPVRSRRCDMPAPTIWDLVRQGLRSECFAHDCMGIGLHRRFHIGDCDVEPFLRASGRRGDGRTRCEYQ